MLQLFANGQQLDTAGVSFNLTRKNPLFLNSLEGDYAYDIQLPLTDNNKKNLINFANRIETNNQTGSSVIECFFNGIRLFEGTWITKKIGKNISGSIVSGSGNFLYDIQDKYLNEFNYGHKIFQAAIDAETYFNIHVDDIYPEVDFCLPMILSRNEELETTDIFLPADVTNYFQKDVLNYYDSGYTVLPDPPLSNSIIVPHLFLRFVLKKLFNIHGYNFDDTFFTDDYYKKLCIWNIYNARGGIPEIPDEDPGYSSPGINNIIYSNHLPRILIIDTLSGLQNLVNVRFFFNHLDKSVIAKDALEVLKSVEYTDITSKVINEFSIDRTKTTGFRLSETPDGNDSWYNFKSEKADDTFNKYYIGCFNSLSDLPTDSENLNVGYVKDQGSYYQYNSIPSSWEKITTNGSIFPLSNYSHPNEELEITSKISTLMVDYSNSLPAQGYSAYDYREMPLRLLFYEGGAESLGHSGTRYLNYDDHYLYDYRWKDYLDFILNPVVVEIKAMLSAVDISNLDLSRKIRVNGINYLIKEIKIPVKENSIGAATLECYKV